MELPAHLDGNRNPGMARWIPSVPIRRAGRGGLTIYTVVVTSWNLLLPQPGEEQAPFDSIAEAPDHSGERKH